MVLFGCFRHYVCCNISQISYIESRLVSAAYCVLNLSISTGQRQLINWVSDLRNLEGSSEDQPPPKPSRVPSKRLQQKPAVAKRDPVPVTQYVNNCEGVYSELADNGSSCHVTEAGDPATRPSDIKRHGLPALPHRTLIRTGAAGLTQMPAGQCSDIVACNRVVTVPEIDPPSTFDLVTFATTLLPSDNKPLDKSIMARVRSVLLESGPRALANHLTRLDLDMLGLKGERDLGLGVSVGLELLALPQGSRFRKDLLERWDSYCLSLLNALEILLRLSCWECVIWVFKIFEGTPHQDLP